MIPWSMVESLFWETYPLVSYAWWLIFIIPAFEELRQEDNHKFKVSLGYRVKAHLQVREGRRERGRGGGQGRERDGGREESITSRIIQPPPACGSHHPALQISSFPSQSWTSLVWLHLPGNLKHGINILQSSVRREGEWGRVWDRLPLYLEIQKERKGAFRMAEWRGEAERQDRQGSEWKPRASHVPCLSIPGFCLFLREWILSLQNEPFYSCPFWNGFCSFSLELGKMLQ